MEDVTRTSVRFCLTKNGASSNLIYGLDTHPNPREHSHVGGILKAPFRAYRMPVGEK